jgi:hypothetical protein
MIRQRGFRTNEMKGVAMRFNKDDPSSQTPADLDAMISEAEIDETLDETFPASDPPQWTLGTDHGSPSPKARKTRRTPWHS